MSPEIRFNIIGVLSFIVAIWIRYVPESLLTPAFLFQVILMAFMCGELEKFKDERIVGIGNFVVGTAMWFYLTIAIVCAPLVMR